MKKLFTLITLLPLALSSQILNPSFESVTAGKPNNYNLGFYSSYQISDTSASHTGSQAAYIRGLSAQSYSVQGAVLGLFSMSGKPATLNGWYKCNVQPSDSIVFMAYVYPVTTFTNSFTRSYAFTTTSTNIYKQFISVIDYSLCPATNYDSLFVSIYLSGTNVDVQNVAIPQTGTWAIIDDLVLGLDPTGIKENNISKITQVSPNPTLGKSLVYFSMNTVSKSSLRLTDITGKILKTVFENEKLTDGNYKIEIDLADLPQGVYLAELEVNGNKQVSKIIKQ